MRDTNMWKKVPSTVRGEQDCVTVFFRSRYLFLFWNYRDMTSVEVKSRKKTGVENPRVLCDVIFLRNSVKTDAKPS